MLDGSRPWVSGGFPGQRLTVVPRDVVAQARSRMPTSMLAVTDVGYFPRAIHHGVDRPHGAPEAIVIICITGIGWCSDSARSDSDGPTIEVPAGYALLIPPGAPHRYWTGVDEPWTIWWVHVTGQAVPDWVDRLGHGDRPATFEVRSQGRAVEQVRAALTALEDPRGRSSMMRAAGAAWSLLTGLLADQEDGAQRSAPVRHALARLRADLASQVSVPEIAAEVGLSSSHLAALFRQATGHGMLAHRTELRMSRARELLAITTAPVREIAAEVGYPDPFYFSRQFRTMNGCTPTAYRREVTADLIVPPDDPD